MWTLNAIAKISAMLGHSSQSTLPANSCRPVYVGQRNAEDAWEILTDLRSRLVSRVQLTSDGHKCYLTTVPEVFDEEIDFAQLVKHFGRAVAHPPTHKYSPPPVNRISTP